MKEYFLKKADQYLPKLKEDAIVPTDEVFELGTGDSFVLDLGNHYVGYFSFKMWHLDEYVDAPIRLSVKFLESKGEIDDDFNDYRGWLCRSWLQDEIINVDFPGIYEMPRRYACRYIKIEVFCTPKRFTLSDFSFRAVSAVSLADAMPANIPDARLREIDRVGMNTLKNCMQRIFEDGPKRDRRLWIGDLRLEALANYYTFGNTDLVKRCLYLFAAADRNEFGFMPGFVYENPIFYSGSWYLEDYSLLYVCTLCDYYEHTGDGELFRELYPTAKSIMDAANAALDGNGIMLPPTDESDVFIDWCEGLRKISALQGVYHYTLDSWVRALAALGYPDAALYNERLTAGRAAARAHLFDESRGAAINSYDGGQYSVHATAWMILGGAIEGDEARRAITDALAAEDSLKPFTPYMHHYTVEALMKAGLTDEAVAYVKRIWGGMIDAGADTFFEAYDPNDPTFSPYDDRKVNSMCHAWSCTPTYLIRKYGLGSSGEC